MHKCQSAIAINEHMQIISAQVETSPLWNNDFTMAGYVTELAFDLCHIEWKN